MQDFGQYEPVGGYTLLLATLAALGRVVAGWALVMCPVSLRCRLTSPSFLRPTLALAAATGALSVG